MDLIAAVATRSSALVATGDSGERINDSQPSSLSREKRKEWKSRHSPAT